MGDRDGLPKKLADGIRKLGVDYMGQRFYFKGQQLRTVWSPAACDSLKASHGLDAAEELADIVLEEIRMAVDCLRAEGPLWADK